MTKDKDYYHLSAMTTLLMTTDPLLRPSATTVLEFDCFDELRTLLNIKKDRLVYQRGFCGICSF